MKLDLSKLSDAVAKVASLAQANALGNADFATLKAAHDAMLADIHASQADIDTLTASLLAAITSPAEAVGLAAVAAAVATPTTAVLPTVSPVDPAPAPAPAEPVAPVVPVSPSPASAPAVADAAPAPVAPAPVVAEPAAPAVDPLAAAFAAALKK